MKSSKIKISQSKVKKELKALS